MINENKTMTEQELRDFDPAGIEQLDIAWDNGTAENPYKFIGKVLFDYDQGLSIINKEDSDDCLTGIHGPSYNGCSNYTTKEEYHKKLSCILKSLKKGLF